MLDGALDPSLIQPVILDPRERLMESLGPQRTCIDWIEHTRRMKRVLLEGWRSIRCLQGKYSGPVHIVGSGPSAADTVPDIPADEPILAINKSADWVRKVLGRAPEFAFMADAGEHCSRYQTAHGSTTYLYSVTVHADAFAKVRWCNVYTFIPFLPETVAPPQYIQKCLLTHHTFQDWAYLDNMGPTGGTGAIQVAGYLGFTEPHLHGFDGCFTNGRLHAYDKEIVNVWQLPTGEIEVLDATVRADDGSGYNFKTTRAMMRQVIGWDDFMTVLNEASNANLTPIKNIVCHGEGAIPWKMKKAGLHAAA